LVKRVIFQQYRLKKPYFAMEMRGATVVRQPSFSQQSASIAGGSIITHVLVHEIGHHFGFSGMAAPDWLESFYASKFFRRLRVTTDLCTASAILNFVRGAFPNIDRRTMTAGRYEGATAEKAVPSPSVVR
jgi:hypothetical protein